MHTISRVVLGLGLIFTFKAFATNLHITTGFTPPVSDYFQKILSEADKRLDDISISFELLPAERSLQLVEEGINDGDCCRIPEIIFKSYKNMVKVPVSFYTVRFSVFTRTGKQDIKQFADLKPYSVGTVKGWKAAVINIRKIQPAEVYVVTKPEQMFGMLDIGRIDYGVMGYMSGLKVISDLKLNHIKVIEPPLIEKKLYLLISKKHSSLVPRLTKVFEDITNDGSALKYYKEIIESLHLN